MSYSYVPQLFTMKLIATGVFLFLIGVLVFEYQGLDGRGDIRSDAAYRRLAFGVDF